MFRTSRVDEHRHRYRRHGSPRGGATKRNFPEVMGKSTDGPESQVVTSSVSRGSTSVVRPPTRLPVTPPYPPEGPRAPSTSRRNSSSDLPGVRPTHREVTGLGTRSLSRDPRWRRKPTTSTDPKGTPVTDVQGRVLAGLDGDVERRRGRPRGGGAGGGGPKHGLSSTLNPARHLPHYRTGEPDDGPLRPRSPR